MILYSKENVLISYGVIPFIGDINPFNIENSNYIDDVEETIFTNKISE